MQQPRLPGTMMIRNASMPTAQQAAYLGTKVGSSRAR
jgi:hypothetical protein